MIALILFSGDLMMRRGLLGGGPERFRRDLHLLRVIEYVFQIKWSKRNKIN